MRRNIIEEITDAKERHSLFSSGNLPVKVRQIEETIDNIENNNSQEMINFIPVQIVALFQSHFREVIIDLIDNEKVSLSEIETLTKTKNIKFDVRTLKALKENKFTLGELISHLFSFNNLNDANQVLSTLLKKDFLNELKGFEYQKVNKDENLNIENILKDKFGEIIKSLDEVFRLRNIICHEYAFNIDLNLEKIKNLWKNSVLFLSHSSIYTSTFDDATPPLSLQELGENSRKRNLSLSEEIDSISEEIISLNEKETFDIELFKSSITKWREYIDLKVNASVGYLQNTELDLFYYVFKNSEFEKKLEDLKELLKRKSKEGLIDQNSPHFKMLINHIEREIS
ncbi:hypothetical protein [Christiangramia sp. LLG6405-1]|uniref:hypothetical protein n=1 Tax=Christiangramia sp. LLG6405-1 TaxID=3160832 RepID=UPI0038687154